MPTSYSPGLGLITTGALSLASTTATQGQTFATTVSGKAAGTVVTATSAGGSFSVSGTALVGTFTTSGTVSVLLTEYIPGSPTTNITPVNVTVAAATALQPLSLSQNIGTQGSVFTATILGQTNGSTLSATSSDGTPISVSGNTLTATFPMYASPVLSVTEALGSVSQTTKLRVDINAVGGGGVVPVSIGPATAQLVTGAAPGSSVIAFLTNVPIGQTPVFTPTNGGDANKIAVAGGGLDPNGAVRPWYLVPGLVAATAGTISGTITAGSASGTITITVGTGSIVADPAEFAARWPTAPAVREFGSTLATDFDTASTLPTPDATIYVNLSVVGGVTGNDTTGTGSTTQPFATRNKAMTFANATYTAGQNVQIIYRASQNYSGRGTNCGANIVPVPNIAEINISGFRVRFAKTTSVGALTFTLVSGNVYSSPISSGGAQSVIDATAALAETPIDLLTVGAIDYIPTVYKTYKKVVDYAACAATPYSWFHDGTNLNVNMNGANNGAALYVCDSGNLGRSPQGANAKYYMERIDWIGGDSPFLAVASATGISLTHRYCTFQGSNPTQTKHGFAVQGPLTVYGYRSCASYNAADGLNYHSFESDGTTQGTSPNVWEDQCSALGNGTTGSGDPSSNASTGHDFANIKRLNCIYPSSDAILVAESNSCFSVNHGVVTGIKFTGNPGGFGNSNNCKMWVNRCAVTQFNNTYQGYGATDTAVIYVRNQPTPVNRPGAGGTIATW